MKLIDLLRPHASLLAAGGPAANGNCFDPQGCFPFSPTNIYIERHKVHSLARAGIRLTATSLMRTNLSCLLRTNFYPYARTNLFFQPRAPGNDSFYFCVASRGLVQVVNLILAAKASH
jgi:hypothetical protein